MRVRLTVENITTALRPGDVFTGEDLPPVKSARVTVDGFNDARVYFTDGTSDIFGLPQTVEITRDSPTAYVDGDYVIVSHPDETTDYVPGHDTFRVTGHTVNRFGSVLVKCANIAYPNNPPTVFYPHELSWEDGSRPV